MERRLKAQLKKQHGINQNLQEKLETLSVKFAQGVKSRLGHNCGKLIINSQGNHKFLLFSSIQSVRPSVLRNVFKFNLMPLLRTMCMRSSRLVLGISYTQSSYLGLSQTPKMNGFELISELGGTLSLFVGITFLSPLEFFEYFFEIFWFFYSNDEMNNKLNNL